MPDALRAATYPKYHDGMIIGVFQRDRLMNIGAEPWIPPIKPTAHRPPIIVKNKIVTGRAANELRVRDLNRCVFVIADTCVDDSNSP